MTPTPPNLLSAVVKAMRAWPDVALAPREHDAVELHVDGKEVGHLQPPRTVDVPFPTAIAAVLPHQNRLRGIVTLHDDTRVRLTVDSGGDVRDALYVLQLSYLYRMTMRCKRIGDLAWVEAQLDSLEFSPSLRHVFEGVIRRQEQVIGDRPRACERSSRSLTQ